MEKLIFNLERVGFVVKLDESEGASYNVSLLKRSFIDQVVLGDLKNMSFEVTNLIDRFLEERNNWKEPFELDFFVGIYDQLIFDLEWEEERVLSFFVENSTIGFLQKYQSAVLYWKHFNSETDDV